MKKKKTKAIGNLFNDGVLVSVASEKVSGLYEDTYDNINVIAKMVVTWVMAMTDENETKIKTFEESEKFVKESFVKTSETQSGFTYTYKKLTATINYI